jgi:hypothetical protein
MVIVVDLPSDEDAGSQVQELIDGEIGAGTFVVKRTQLVATSAIGYRFHVVIEEAEPIVIDLTKGADSVRT